MIKHCSQLTQDVLLMRMRITFDLSIYKLAFQVTFLFIEGFKYH